MGETLGTPGYRITASAWSPAWFPAPLRQSATARRGTSPRSDAAISRNEPCARSRVQTHDRVVALARKRDAELDVAGEQVSRLDEPLRRGPHLGEIGIAARVPLGD